LYSSVMKGQNLFTIFNYEIIFKTNFL